MSARLGRTATRLSNSHVRERKRVACLRACYYTYRASKFSSGCDTTPAIPQHCVVILMPLAAFRVHPSSSSRMLRDPAATTAARRPREASRLLLLLLPWLHPKDDEDDLSSGPYRDNVEAAADICVALVLV